MRILAINGGSSSVKFALLDAESAEPCLRGVAEDLRAQAAARLRWRDRDAADHATALREIVALIRGRADDWRSIVAVGHRVVHGGEEFRDSVELFCYRLAKYVAALVVPLGRLDALVFTGGIGEHATGVRARVLALLTHLGLQLDEERNAVHGRDSRGVITRPGPPVALVVPTDEELLIAREAAALLR